MSRTRRPLLVRVLQPMWTMCNEVALNIRTTPRDGGPVGFHSRHEDSSQYEVPDYLYMRRIRKILQPGAEDVVFDVGCGMGRFLCVMARRKLRKCVGVELQPQLCEAARKNAAHLRGRKAPIEIVCADAATADLSDGTIYYMYNPFGADTMADVLANIRGTLSRNPRKITIVYYNARHEKLFERCEWLEKYQVFKIKSGMPVSFWRNCHGDVKVPAGQHRFLSKQMFAPNDRREVSSG
jgi:SAM-dependent methyltransferase